VKTGPVVVDDADGTDDDGCEAEEQSDVAGSNEQPMFPEGHQGMPLRQRQLHGIAHRPVSGLLFLSFRPLLCGGWRRDFERKCRMTESVESWIISRQRAVDLTLLDLERRIDEPVTVQTRLYTVAQNVNPLFVPFFKTPNCVCHLQKKISFELLFKRVLWQALTVELNTPRAWVQWPKSVPSDGHLHAFSRFTA